MQRLPRMPKFGLAVRVPPLKLRDRRFRHHQPIVVDPEIVIARDHPRETVHQHSVTIFRRDVEHNPPPFAVPVVRPVIMRHHHLPVFCPPSPASKSPPISPAPQTPRLLPL